jgi:hypothetical protein
MVNRNRDDELRAALERIEIDPRTNVGGYLLKLAVWLESDPVRAEIDAHNTGTNEVAMYYDLARRAGPPFSKVADLCARVLRGQQRGDLLQQQRPHA